MLGQSWLSENLAAGSSRWLFIGLWLAAALGFIATGSGLLSRKPWWRRLAVISSLVSLPTTLLFYRPTMNLTGALLDHAILDGASLAGANPRHVDSSTVLLGTVSHAA